MTIQVVGMMITMKSDYHDYHYQHDYYCIIIVTITINIIILNNGFRLIFEFYEMYYYFVYVYVTITVDLVIFQTKVLNYKTINSLLYIMIYSIFMKYNKNRKGFRRKQGGNRLKVNYIL